MFTPMTLMVAADHGEDGSTVSPIGDHSRMSRRWKTRLAICGAFLALLALYTASPIWSRSDPLWIPFTAQSLLDDHDLDLSDRGFRAGDDYALVEHDGQVVSYFPWTTAALTTPLVVAHAGLERLGVVTPLRDQLASLDVGPFQRFAGGTFAAAAAVVLALLTRQLLRVVRPVADPLLDGATVDPGLAERWWFVPLCTFVLGLATPLWSTASRGLWQHGPGVLLLAGAWLAALADLAPHHAAPDRSTAEVTTRWWPIVLSGVLAGLACGVRPTNLVLVASLGGFLVWRRRAVVTRWVIATLGIAVAGIAANVVLLGSPLPSYFSAGRIGPHPAIVRAVMDNVVSPSRGLLVFSPWLALGAVALTRGRRERLGGDVTAFATLAAAATAATALAMASYGEHWWAGHSFGPRFMSETVVVLGPLALVTIFGPRPRTAAGRRSSTIVAPLLIVVSVLMHAPGAVTEITECWSRTPVDVDGDPQRVEDWSDAQSVAGWVTLVRDGPAAPVEVCEADRA